MVILGLIVFAVLNINNIKQAVAPFNYSDYIMEYSQKYDLDPVMVSAVIKTESNFEADAVSSKNAYGLMQITKETAHWAAGKMGIDDFTTDMLMDPETNIMIGCWYLDNLDKEFGSTDLVLAAYNAGRGNVQQWLDDPAHSSDGKTLTDIPFEETENYIKKVKIFYKIYEFLYF
ncbi:MAG: transglycosylase domain protein [Firmicutes bacterium]|nr:transglycosylase domain protein [Bacillota bacterium]